MGKTASGLDPKLVSVLCYLFFPFIAFFFVITEKENKEVKFHAWNGFLIGLVFLVSEFCIWILAVIFGRFSYWTASALMSFNKVIIIAVIGCMGFLMYQVYRGKKIEVIFVSRVARKQSLK